ncbi:hypothetical protein CHARACLAT_032670 [Characodon lateralis]|uniref:Uncharacterized protein n=1 Tax=Characodon lateralis TaxID=208331 RepID=A0ABU7ESK4_9TELE|nr:hypothetical protein [Characodon lateralis]
MKRLKELRLGLEREKAFWSGSGLGLAFRLSQDCLDFLGSRSLASEPGSLVGGAPVRGSWQCAVLIEMWLRFGGGSGWPAWCMFPSHKLMGWGCRMVGAGLAVCCSAGCCVWVGMRRPAKGWREGAAPCGVEVCVLFLDVGSLAFGSAERRW